jgi:hypothetical protein
VADAREPCQALLCLHTCSHSSRHVSTRRQPSRVVCLHASAYHYSAA